MYKAIDSEAHRQTITDGGIERIMEIKGTRSEANLLAAFMNEAGARTKYLIYALLAKKEGHSEIAELFNKMAENELEHSKVWFNLIQGETTVLENLKDAAQSENNQWKYMYPQFAAIAREEGNEELALMFERVASIESEHERKFTEAVLRLQNQQKDTAWEKGKRAEGCCCIFCGQLSEAALEICPVCGAKNSFTSLE